MNSKKNWATEEQLNKPETQTNEQAETRANEHPSERKTEGVTLLK